MRGWAGRSKAKPTAEGGRPPQATQKRRGPVTPGCHTSMALG